MRCRATIVRAMNAVPDTWLYRRTGRTIGAVLLVQLVVAPIVNFGLLEAAFAPPGFLVNAAAHSVQVSTAALLGLALGALSLGIAIAAFPVLRQSSHALALWLLTLAIASFSLTAVESSTVLSLLSLSQAYVKANAADDGLFQTLRTVVGSARNWMHYVGLIVAGSMIFVLYGALFRLALVPRALAAFGLGGALLQLAAVTMPLFGHPIVYLMLLPLGLSHLALAGWLLARGLREPEQAASRIPV
jgi:hypothetical protein